MTIKTILVPILEPSVDRAAVDTAISVGRVMEGHLDGLFIAPPLDVRRTVPPSAGFVEAGTSARITAGIEQNRLQAERAAEARVRRAIALRREFERRCYARGVSVCKPDAVADGTTASWLETEGYGADAVMSRAPAYDLVVLPSPTASDDARRMAEQVLLDTRRPVLLAPAYPEESEDDEPSIDTAVIAWTPALQTWHAVTAAVPLLGRTRRVELVEIVPEGASATGAAPEVLRYLGWHGIEATVRQARPTDGNVGDAVLFEARERNADLLVMGAYSHSRLREMLLGGVTRHVLANAAATPVLMAH
jgi:nucleotide-binding universal stress UspA family protein